MGEHAWRKVRLQIEEVKNFDCYTNFYGLDITRDQLCALVKKWHTTIEAFAQARTSDGYLCRMFCIAFTKRHKKQVKLLATPRTHDRSLSVKRCRRSWLPSARNQPSEISSRSASPTILQGKSPPPAIKSSHSRTSSSVRSRSSRSPSSILPSSWSSTAPRPMPSAQS